MRPNQAVALIYGGPRYPAIRGWVGYQDVPGGTYVTVNIAGLPPYQPGSHDQEPIGPHGFHIHEFGNCAVGDAQNPFQQAGEHWNPDNQPHGHHAGDFPVLFSYDGRCYMEFFTNRFRVTDIIGRSVIIHENPDDYRTQPAGNSGQRIACGIIRAV